MTDRFARRAVVRSPASGSRLAGPSGRVACALVAAAAWLLTSTFVPTTASAAAIDPGRGINLGNALEAPVEGQWGLVIEDGWFDLIADAGFDSVRLPVRFSAHVGSAPAYAIDEALLERIDGLLAEARRTGLAVVLDYHHDDALMRDPSGERARYLATWRQIAARYADAGDDVAFELLNEPHGRFDDEPSLWNALLHDALAIVRQVDPDRTVVVGPVGYNGIDRLSDLRLPADANLLLTVHYYSPFAFTHQGASWASPVPPVGLDWRADRVQLATGVEDWSWDAVATSVDDALALRFDRAWAGFAPRWRRPMQPDRLIVRARGRGTLAVGCERGTEIDFVSELTVASSAWQRTTVDLDACGDAVRRIAFADPTGDSAVEFAALRICDANRCRALLDRADVAVRRDIGRAARWAKARGLPLYVGEFGAYGAADLTSRVRWTATVVDAVARVGASSAYWEFGAGFGAWDPATGRWRAPLLRALQGR